MFSLAFCVPAPRLTTYPPKTAQNRGSSPKSARQKLKKCTQNFFLNILRKQKKSYILSCTRALYDKNSFPAPTWAGFLKLRQVWNIHALNA